MASTYLSAQLNGPVIQAIVQGIQAAFQEPNPLITYWTTLSILTAQDVDGTLNYVGALSGYPRPLVSNVFFASNVILFSDANILPTSYTRSDLTFLSGDNSVNTAAGNFITAGFAQGNWISFAGSVSNNYTAQVLTITALKMVLAHITVVAEADANSITITIQPMSTGLDDTTYTPAVNAPYNYNPSAGVFDTALPLSSNIMPALWYRQLLPIFAEIEYYGLSIYTVDLLAAWALGAGGGTTYTITRDQYNNIVVIFGGSGITAPALYAANAVVQAVETLPLVVFEEI